VPGPKGDAGAGGTNGTNGQNAYTTLSANFTMPAELATANATVVNSGYITLNQVLCLLGSYLQATAIIDAVTVTLKNLEDAGSAAYAGNAAPGTVFASGSKLSPGGFQGPAGAASAGALLAANNLSDLTTVATARTNLGLGTMATQAASAVTITGGSITGITDLAVADGGTGASTAAGARTNLGVAIGSDVQQYDAELAALAGLVSAADRLPYFTGAGTAGLAVFTAVARTLVNAATVAAQRGVLAVLPRYGLLGSLVGANFNSGSDQAITIVGSSRYIIRRIVVDNASISLTTAAGGFYTGAGMSGTTIVAAGQVYSALTASSKYLSLTLEAVVGTDVFTAATVYLALSTPQGSAATANVWIWGEDVG
jgi:hypothetical protein